MPDSTFRFGPLAIDVAAYGSQGSAILGIRDSGKTYTATKLAELLHAGGVPFVAFDPIGTWRFLRVPGAGRGIPVVVAGGVAGDLPLRPDTAAAIVDPDRLGIIVGFDRGGRLPSVHWAGNKYPSSTVSPALIELVRAAADLDGAGL